MTDPERLQPYESRTAAEIVRLLPSLSDAEVAWVGAHERAGRARKTILARVEALQAAARAPLDPRAIKEI
jgi:hypothetical protein